MAGDYVEDKLNAAMPWIGIYIAAASAICTLAMAADAFNGFRRKRLWFPSKYFSLNATTLTLLSVAMKLPMDLNTNMLNSPADSIAKYISTLFMSTALANFMSSLGSMTDKEILANVVALGILVITVAANVFIQFILLSSYLSLFTVLVSMIPAIWMLFLLSKLVSMAIMVPTIKRKLEAKYQEKHKITLREEAVLNRRDSNLRGEMMKYWVMAETSNPQFVMSRSVVCTTANCFLAALALIATYTSCLVLLKIQSFLNTKSVYQTSTIVIQVIQFIGVVVGSIAPTLRWFAAVSFRCSSMNWCSFKNAFKVESHWTQILLDYRDSFAGSHIKKERFKKILNDAKWYAITFCIGLQILTLQLSKVFVFLSVLLTSSFFMFFALIRIFVSRRSTKVDDNVDSNLSSYVLLLEGEPEIPTRVLKNMCREADNTIQTGRKKQPRNLPRLLGQFGSFNGVGQFDSNQIPSLHSQEPPNNWTLPVLTLISIAIALPNIADHKTAHLLSSVSEGLSLANLVEKTLYENAQLVNIRKAADNCWAGVLFYTKWFDVNLNKISSKCRNSNEVLQLLAKKAEEIVMNFKNREGDPIMENPLNWPGKVVVANLMYRISRTILLSYEEESKQMDEGLYDRLSVMITSILAACLTNLPHVINAMCHRNAIEKREKSVRKAFLLLGKTEQIVELLQQHEWPYLDHDKAAYIEEWRTLFQQDHPSESSFSTAGDDQLMTFSMSSEEQLDILVD